MSLQGITNESTAEIDPLLPLKHSDNDEQQPSSRNDSYRSRANQPPLNDLEEAANDVYEAIVENDEEYDEDEHNEDVIWLREQRLLNKATHWFKRPSVLMIASITFLLAFASSSAESTRQLVTLKLACNALGAERCTRDSAQVLMSDLQLGYSISGAIITLISSGKIAPMSDIYGRKVFVVALIASFLIGKALKFLIMYNFDSLQFYPMIACEIATNLCGGIMSLIALNNCYISDVVEPHQRIYSLGLSLAAMFVGLSVGPLAGNVVISISQKYYANIDIASQEFIPLKLEILLILVDLLVAIFILPESRSEKARKKSRSLSQSLSRVSLSNINTEAVTVVEPKWNMRLVMDQLNFLKPLRLLIIPRELVNASNINTIKRDRFAIIVLVSIECLMSTMAISFGEIMILYGIYSYNWDQSNLGQFLAVACASKAVVLIVLSPVINHKILQHGFGFRVFKKRIDMVDFSMLSLGLVCEILGLIGYSLAPTTMVFFGCTVICGFGSLIGPAINSSIVKFYPEAKIGELFGATSLLRNLFALVTPIFYLSVYKFALSKLHRPGIVFIVAGSILTIGLIMLIIVKHMLGLNSKTEAPPLSRSNSVSSFVLAPPSPQQFQNARQNSFGDLHRKNSFVQKERTASIKQ